MLSLLSNAISTRTILSINYDPGWRVVEPHAVGYSRDGNALLRAYQTEGASSSGEHVHWKLFRMDKIRSAERTDQRFIDPRPGYRRNDSAMSGGIISQL